MAGSISALKIQKKHQDRVNVYLDGKFAFELKGIVAAHLRVGQRLTDAEIEALKERDAFEKAYDRALDFLSYRPRSVMEVKRNLHGKGLPESVIEAVIERLEQAGLLDDEAFACYWVEQRERFKPRSARMLRYELRQKGVDDHAIDRALHALNETESAYHAGAGRARRYAHLDRPAFWRKMVGYLQRRGFRYDTVKPVVEQLWQELSDENQEVRDE